MVCFAGIIQKMKEGAENVQTKIQAKVESLKTAADGGKGNSNAQRIVFQSYFISF